MQSGTSVITVWGGLDVLQSWTAFLHYKAGQVVLQNRAVITRSEKVQSTKIKKTFV